jgi:hypothetical protein
MASRGSHGRASRWFGLENGGFGLTSSIIIVTWPSRFVYVGDIGSRAVSTMRDERAQIFIKLSLFLCAHLRRTSG